MRTSKFSRLSSRVLLATLAAILVAVVQGCGSGGSSGATGSGGNTTVTFGVSAKAPGGNMLQLGIAQAQGYFTSEGITVKPVFLGSSGAVVQALASGKIQIGTSTPDLALEAIEKGQKIKMFYNWTTKTVTKFAVLPDSPIHSVSDLKGKTVGVQELSSGPAQLAKAAAVNAGLDPDTDLKFVAVGSGAPALDALVRHRIDTMVTYDTLFAAMTHGTGTKLRLFSPEGFEDLFSSSFVASTSWLQENKDIAAGFGRAWAKASVYADANPKAGIKMMFERYPNSKVGSNTKEATDAALTQFKARQQSLYGGTPPEDQQWGAYSKDAVEHWIRYAKDHKLIKMSLDPNQVYTNEFVAEYNKFNADEIRKAAAS